MNRSKLIIILSSAILCVVTILCVMMAMILPSLTGSENRLIFVSDSLESYYDGSVLRGETWSMVSGNLKSGHKAEVVLAGSQRYVGTSKNHMQVRIVNSSGTDVTSDYLIECIPGDLTVKPVNLTITSNSSVKVYDGTPLSDDGYTVVPAYTVPPQHELSVEITGEITEIGETGNTVSKVAVYDADGRDVTFNFNIIVMEGRLIVTDEKGFDTGDVNIDTDHDGIPDLNLDLNGDMLPDINIDVNGDMLPDINIDIDGDMLADTNLDLDGDGKPDVNIDLDGDGKPDVNIGGSGALDLSGNIGGGANGDTVCYRVTADTTGSVYLKIASFGNYGGQSWGMPNQYEGLIYDYGSADYLSGLAMENGGSKQRSLSIEILNGQGVMPYYSHIYGSSFVSKSDVMISYGNTYVDFVYYNSGYKNAVLPDSLIRYEEQYRAFVYENYLYIDAETYAYMQMIAETNGFSVSEPNVIQNVASYIQRAAKYDLDYDKSLDEEENIAIKFLDEYKTGICQHYATAATLLYRALGIPARYTVGFVCSAVAGETVEVTAMQAHAWVEVYIDGIGWIAVEVTGSDGSGTPGVDDPPEKTKTITVAPADCDKQYDGLPLVAENKLRLTSAISEWTQIGYTFVPTVSGERTEPGKSQSVITDLRIYDPAGEDVTDQFDITYNPGVVHVYTAELKFESASVELEYDGIVLEGDALHVAFDGNNLPTGYTWEATPATTARIGKVGRVQNAFNIKVYDEYGKDVTDIYKISKKCGTLEITPRKITITAGSATASYTGEPLTCNDISITSGTLVDGEYIFDYVVEGSQTDRGRSENIVKSIVIYNSNGEDVTGNYSIVFEKGTLKVTN